MIVNKNSRISPPSELFKPAEWTSYGTQGEQSTPIRLSDLWIQTKGDRKHPPQLIRFDPNAVQRLYLDTIQPGWQASGFALRGLREDILKARQFGFSTLILALFYLDTVNNPNITTVVMAHDTESTEGLFEIVKRFHDYLPEGKKPRTRFCNVRRISYPDLGSSISVRTAGTKTVGRSMTIHNLHCSEVAFYDNPKIFTGLLQAVPASGNVFKESTANGEGTQHCADYQAAKAGESVFTARFFAWWRHTEYRTEPPGDFQRVTDASEPKLRELFGDENALAMQYGLDDTQLQWRRGKIAEPGMGSLFRQEYPANDHEAFLVSGSKFFTEWDETRHTCYPREVEIKSWWTPIGGLDWGYGAPFCFLLGFVDEAGSVVIVDEIYRARLTNAEQADLIAQMLAKWNVKPEATTIYADPSMWARKVASDGIGRADIEDFWARSLVCVKANNNRVSGWSNMRRYLHDDGALRVFKGNASNLIRTIPMQVHDATDVEDLDTEREDHPVDACRYLLHSRIRAAAPDPSLPRPVDVRPWYVKRRRVYA
jgi:hypothetical protein